MNDMLTNMRETLKGFANAMNLLCPGVPKNHQRVAYLSYNIAEEMGYDEEDKLALIYASMLYDAGRAILPERDKDGIKKQYLFDEIASAGTGIIGNSPKLSYINKILTGISEDDIENFLDEKSIHELLKSHDIILRRSIPYGNTEDCFRKFMGYEFYEAAKNIFHQVIKDVAPEYEEAFLFALSRHNSGHAFNMFITRRHVFNAYCSWLFPIILEAANRIDFTQLPSPPHSRIIGFMGEAMLMPWLMKQRLRIKELPVREL